jgi:endonuclease-3
MAEPAQAKKARAAKILARLGKAYPGAGIELRFRNPLELLVATILSAQCTDERVNAVTAKLFDRYGKAEDFARAQPAALEREIHSTGFFKSKRAPSSAWAGPSASATAAKCREASRS